MNRNARSVAATMMSACVILTGQPAAKGRPLRWRSARLQTWQLVMSSRGLESVRNFRVDGVQLFSVRDQRGE
jgi:hypothetical protein